jgi:hypothetical protein
MARSLKHRISGYVMLSLMVISFISSISMMGTEFVNVKDNSKNNAPSPLSQNAISSLEINGTQLYEDGRYYFYKNETLNVVSTATTDVTDAWFIYNHTLNPSENGWVKLTKAGNEFSSNIYFAGDVLTGEYNAYISSYNTSTFQNFSFYIIVSDPEPVIHAVYLRDRTWNNVWVRIYEGQIINTYRNTTLELRISVANRDDLNAINSVEVAYENGIQDLWANNKVAGSTGTPSTFKGISVKNYTNTEIKTSFDKTVGGRELWKPGEQFDVSIKANDTANNYWFFEFYVKILNRAPKITEFSVSPSNIPSPGTTSNVIVTVNASDLEDDVVYDASAQEYVPYYAYSRSFGLSPTNAAWNQSSSPSSTALLFRNEGSEHKIKLDQNGYYLVNFTLSPIYAAHISSWDVNYRYWTNTSSNIDIEAYNYNTKSWYKPTGGDLTGSLSLSYDDDGVSFSNLGDYCRQSSGYTIQVRFYQTINPAQHWGKILYVDYINVTYKPLIRTSSPAILLGIYNPISSTGEWVDIKQFWDTTYSPGNRWSYNYTFTKKTNLQGAYTFVVRVYDYGYSDFIHADFLTTTYFEQSSQGFADASYLVNYGIPRGQLNNMTGPGVQINETTHPNANKNLNVKLTVSDTLNGDSAPLNHTYQLDQNELYYQDGTTIKTSSTSYSPIPDNYIQSMGNLTENDGNITRIKLNDAPLLSLRNQSIIFTHYLNQYYWLNSENITKMRFYINWHFDDPVPDISIPMIGVDFFNWETNKWTDTSQKPGWNQPPAASGELNPSPPSTKDLDYWASPELNDKNLINQIVNGSNNNKLMVRIWISSQASTVASYLNCCIDYEAIEVQYENYFSAVMHVADSEGYLSEYPMENTLDDTTFRVWEYDLLIGSNSSRDYIIWFDVQNGNSSSKLIGGRYSSIKISDTNFLNIPYVSFSEQKWWDGNFTISVKQRVLGSTFVMGQSALFRITHTFQTNGTFVLSARIPRSYFDTFSIQFRLGGQLNFESWVSQSVSVDTNSLDYNQATGLWNLSYNFPTTYKAGRYFYRLFLKSTDGNYFATEWGDMRIFNYQPNTFVSDEFNPNGIFYRENTAFPFNIRINDLESEASGITIGFQMNCEDRNGNPYLWNRDADSVVKAEISENTFRLSGTFKFGREINVGDYNNLYIVVTDDDNVWPQTAKLRFAASLSIKNSLPIASIPISSNRSGNELFRNNGVQLYWNITDLDDWNYQNFTLDTFRVDYNNGTVVNPATSLINYDPVHHRFEFNRFYSIYDSNSTHVYTLNYTDPDGDPLVSSQILNLKVKDNLPTLVQIQFENLNKTKDGTIEYYNLVKSGVPIPGNLSAFQIHRGNEIVRITIQLTDIEDSHRSDRNYNISKVYFKLIHNMVSDYDPWPNGLATWDDLEMMQTGSFNGIEKWELNLTLPTSRYFYAGGMQFVVYMKDADNGYGINNSGVFGVSNHAPYFAKIAQNYNRGFNVFVNTTSNPAAVKYGEPILIHVYASDLDIGQLGIVRITVGFQIQTPTRTSFGDAYYTAVDWTYNATDDFYELILHTDITRNPEMTLNALLIRITDITIEDNDAGNVDNTDKYGDVLATIIDLNYELDVYALPVVPFNIWVVIIPIAAVGVAVFLVWYYRKYFSYRKYMD